MFFAEKTEKTVSLRLNGCDTQRVPFEKGVPPPFYSCSVPESDSRWRGWARADAERGRDTAPLLSGMITTRATSCRNGTSVRPKECARCLGERGLHVDGMSALEKTALQMMLHAAHRNQLDFRNGKPGVQSLVESPCTTRCYRRSATPHEGGRRGDRPFAKVYPR